jgi:hypothetical protein
MEVTVGSGGGNGAAAYHAQCLRKVERAVSVAQQNGHISCEIAGGDIGFAALLYDNYVPTGYRRTAKLRQEVTGHG